jgi:peptidoglycan-N-acetylglucosamine deacetylase
MKEESENFLKSIFLSIIIGSFGMYFIWSGMANKIKPLNSYFAKPQPTITNPPIASKPTPPPVDCKVDKCVALTFDDGPDPTLTPQYLKILKDNDIKATFFVIGRSVETYPDVLKQVNADGHQICNHTWSHRSLRSMNEDNIKKELTKTEEAISKAIGGENTKCFRSPFGDMPKKFIKDNLEFTHYGWTGDSSDWRFDNPAKPDKNLKLIDKDFQENGNSVILFHDIHKVGITAVPVLISNLKEKGYKFVTVKDLNFEPGMENMGYTEAKIPNVEVNKEEISPTTTEPMKIKNKRVRLHHNKMKK